MKNQYFGDNRDLLKFDLVHQITGAGLVKQFVYVPMLTENEDRYEEPHICRYEATGGSQNTDLIDFLDKAIINEKRNIGQLEEFFRARGIPITIYAKDTVFKDEDRTAYFDNIDGFLLTMSLVLVDPDEGLEGDTIGAGTLLYSELESLYDRMDQESCLMFTQRIPHGMYAEYVDMINAEIRERIPDSIPISLDDLDSVIFFLTKGPFFQSRLVGLLKDYTRQYAKEIESN